VFLCLNVPFYAATKLNQTSAICWELASLSDFTFLKMSFTLNLLNIFKCTLLKPVLTIVIKKFVQ
jgi:hypothetical protein